MAATLLGFAVARVVTTVWVRPYLMPAEHKSTAFDLYQALGGNHAWRIRVFKAVTVMFLGDVTRQTIRNLRHDKALFQWSTWQSAWRLLFRKDGMIRGNLGQWRDYLSPSFHPSQHDAALSAQWLRDNTAAFAVVGQPVGQLA